MEPEPFSDQVEVLGREPTESLTDRGWQWLRDRPLVLATLVVVALAVLGPVLFYEIHGPQLPKISIVDDGTGPSLAPWQAGPDERPSGEVVVAVEAKLQRGASKTSTTVLGIAGPAVIAANNPPVPLPGGKPAVTVPLNAVLDCSTMPAKVSADAYRLRVRTRSGSRMHTGTVDAGTAGTHWLDQIRLACAAWSARQHVTASALTATVNPTLPQADLRLTLTNSGRHSVTLSTAAGYDPTIHLTSASPIRIPAHGSTQAALSVVLDRCDSVVEPPGDNSPLSQTPTLTTAINLVGLDSTVPLTPALTEQVPEGGGLAATGIVLAPAAADALRTALSNACGGLFAPFTVVPAGGVRYDDATGVVTVPVVVYAPRGRVRSVSLSPAAGELPENGYRPLWKALPHLVPDGQGQARVTLRYQRPASGACPNFGGQFPSFVATMEVPVAGGSRTLTYQQSLDLTTDPGAIPLLCGGAVGVDGQEHSAATRSGNVRIDPRTGQPLP